MNRNASVTFHFKVSVLLLIVLLGSSCKYDKAVQISCDAILPDTILFSRDVIQLFNKDCNTPGCHSGSSPEGNLNLEPSVAYSQLNKKGSGYIDTIDAKSSLLYSSLVSVSSPMPPTGKLDDCSIQLILKWMEHGAKNN